MAVKRKTDPMAQAIRDLRYLPRVLEALKALRAKDAEVMALVGGPAIVGLQTWPPSADQMATWHHERARPGILVAPEPPTSARVATPERQEYEAAKKAGKTIPAPDPFEGQQVSEAQRERMARQKAWLESQGRVQVRVDSAMPPGTARMEGADGSSVTITNIGDPVRTEELTTVSDGTAPVPTDEEVH